MSARRGRRAAAPAVVVGLFIGAAGLLVGSPAHAQPNAGDPRTFAAKKACANNQTDEGVAMLAEYYAETGDVMAIYNQGRCYQQNDSHERALSRFREFLRVAKNIAPERRRQAEQQIQELEAEIEKKQERARREAAAATPTQSPTTGAPPVVVAPVVQATPPPSWQASATPPVAMRPAESLSATRAAPESHAGLRVAGFVLGGVAVAAAAGGVYFSTRVSGLQDDVNNAGKGSPNVRPASGDTVLQNIDDGKQAQTLQWVGYGAAIASAAGSVICFLLSGDSTPAPRSRSVALAPAIGGKSGYGAQLHLSF